MNILLLILILVFLYIVFFFRNFLALALKVKTRGPHYLFMTWNNMASLHEFVKKNNIKDFGHVWIGHILVTFAVDPEAAKFLLMNTKPEKGIVKHIPPFPKSIAELVKYSMVWANGEDWRRHRLLANPAFNDDAYQNYFPKMLDMVNKGIEKIDAVRMKENGEVFMTPWSSRLTLDILGAAVFDCDFGMLDDKIHDYYEAYKKVTGRNPLIEMFPWLDQFEIIPMVHQLHERTKSIKKFMTNIIQDKSHTTSTNNIISRMVQSTDENKKLTQQEILADSFLFFLAGHETTATALTWAFYELAYNPLVQEKLFSEIQKSIGDRCPNYQEISIEYLDHFLSENMRLHPPVGMLPSRLAIQDIQYNGLVIPKGSLLCINFYSLHQNPQHWPNPDVFDPDRFLPENKQKRHHFAYIPFSTGTRQCIGMNFSLIEQKLFIIRLLQKFKVVPSKTKKTLELVRENILVTKANVNVFLEPR